MLRQKCHYRHKNDIETLKKNENQIKIAKFPAKIADI